MSELTESSWDVKVIPVVADPEEGFRPNQEFSMPPGWCPFAVTDSIESGFGIALLWLRKMRKE